MRDLSPEEVPDDLREFFEEVEVTDRNGHPTVKSVAVMRWLVRLVTPPGGVVLDPFAGSGSTGIACVLEGFRFVGIEQQGPRFVAEHPGEPDYVAIGRARVAWWAEHGEDGLRITREREAREERAATVRRERADGGQASLFEMPSEPAPSRAVNADRTGEASAERRYADRGGSDFAMKPGRRRRD